MLAAQTPGLWQSQLASLAAKMNSDQSPDSCAGPGMDAVTLQKALLQQQQAFQLQLQNILMLQQSGLNSALNLSSTNLLLSLDLSKGPLKTQSQSPSPNLKEEVDTKMMHVVYSLPALTEDPLMQENFFCQSSHHGGLSRPPMSVPTPFPPFSPTQARMQGYQRPQTQVVQGYLKRYNY